MKLLGQHYHGEPEHDRGKGEQEQGGGVAPAAAEEVGRTEQEQGHNEANDLEAGGHAQVPGKGEDQERPQHQQDRLLSDQAGQAEDGDANNGRPAHKDDGQGGEHLFILCFSFL